MIAEVLLLTPVSLLLERSKKRQEMAPAVASPIGPKRRFDPKFKLVKCGGRLLPKQPSKRADIRLSSASKFSSLGGWFVHGPLVSRFQQSFTRAHDYGRK